MPRDARLHYAGDGFPLLPQYDMSWTTNMGISVMSSYLRDMWRTWADIRVLKYDADMSQVIVREIIAPTWIGRKSAHDLSTTYESLGIPQG